MEGMIVIVCSGGCGKTSDQVSPIEFWRGGFKKPVGPDNLVPEWTCRECMEIRQIDSGHTAKGVIMKCTRCGNEFEQPAGLPTNICGSCADDLRQEELAEEDIHEPKNKEYPTIPF